MIPHVNDNIQYLSFSVWLISLSIVPSKSIHVVANGKISFFFYGWIVFLCIYIPHLLYPFICWWTPRLLPYLAIVNNSAMNLGYMYPFGLVFSFSLDIYPGVELLDHTVVLFLVFWGNSILFPTVAAPVYIPINSVQKFPFSASSPTFVIYVLFDGSHSDRCWVISHCSFNLHFSGD